MQGNVSLVRTSLTADITDSDTVVPVADTTGFPNCGIAVIEDERIAYASKDATNLKGLIAQPLNRGVQGTTAVSHSSGKIVTPLEGSFMNASAGYNIAVLTDTSGAMWFVCAPLALLKLISSFFFLPLQFLGTDLQILTQVWAIFGIGTLIAIAVAVLGGRRV